jgi:hypothetical protein
VWQTFPAKCPIPHGLARRRRAPCAANPLTGIGDGSYYSMMAGVGLVRCTSSRSNLSAMAIALAQGLVGCITPPVANVDPAVPTTNNTATLEGFAVEVDGNYTRGDGQPIALPPGSHIVKTSADTLIETHEALYIFWRIPPVAYFRVDARPAYRYRIERSVKRVDNNRFNILVVAVRAIDPNGAVVATQQVAAGPPQEQEVPKCPG